MALKMRSDIRKMFPLRDEPGKRKALLLTLLVHVVLLLFLFFGVQWRHHPETVEVELWSDVPRPAAHAVQPEPVHEPPKPRPEPKPEPKPPPKPPPKPVQEPPKPPAKPDIAVKEEKKQPHKRVEPEPRKPEVKPAWQEALDRESKQIDAQRAAQAAAERTQQLAAAAEAEQRAAARASSLASYVAKIQAKIRGNMMLPPGFSGNPEAVFEVSQLPTGEILGVRLKRTSGQAALDAAIERAILKSSPLPKPTDASVFQRVLEIRYRPFD